MLMKSSDWYAPYYSILDCHGRQIPFVYSYDTETKEIEIAITIASSTSSAAVLLQEPKDDNPENCTVTRVKFKLPGSYVVRHNSGTVVEKIELDMALLLQTHLAKYKNSFMTAT